MALYPVLKKKLQSSTLIPTFPPEVRFLQGPLCLPWQCVFAVPCCWRLCRQSSVTIYTSSMYTNSGDKTSSKLMLPLYLP